MFKALGNYNYLAYAYLFFFLKYVLLGYFKYDYKKNCSKKENKYLEEEEYEEYENNEKCKNNAYKFWSHNIDYYVNAAVYLFCAFVYLGLVQKHKDHKE